MQEKSLAVSVQRETEIPRLMNKLSEVIIATLDAANCLDGKLSNSILRSPIPETAQNAKEVSLPITGLGESIHDKIGEVRKINVIITNIMDRLEI